MTFGRALPGAMMAIGLVAVSNEAPAQAPVATVQQPASTTATDDARTPMSDSEWTLGGFLDMGYSKSFNSPSNHLFRSRGTTPRVDELDVNMAGGYVRKRTSESSPWGLEVTVHAGEDSKAFAFSATASDIGGAKWLHHLGPTNVSRVAPI